VSWCKRVRKKCGRVLGDALRHVLQIIEKYEGNEYGTRRYEYGTR